VLFDPGIKQAGALRSDITQGKTIGRWRSPGVESHSEDVKVTGLTDPTSRT